MAQPLVAVLRLTPLSTLKLHVELRVLLLETSHLGVPLTPQAARAIVTNATASAPGAGALGLNVHGIVEKRRSMGGVVFIDLTMPGDGSSCTPLQVVVCPSDLTGGLRGLALQITLRRHSAIRIEGVAGASRSGEPSLLARSLHLLGLPADHAAILKVVRLLVSSDDLPAEQAAEALGCSLEDLYDLAHALEAAEDAGEGEEAVAKRARSLASSLRRLSQQRAQHGDQSLLHVRGRRERPPRFASAELSLLSRLAAAHADMTPVHTTALAPAAEVDAALRGPLAPECGLPAELPPAEREVRLAYYHQKKVPQLRWMLHQAKELLEARAAADGRRAAPPLAPRPARPPAPPPLVVDLGCGKGDFTLLLAAALPSLRVLGIDTNADAIKYAETRALAAGLRNVRFQMANAAELMGSATESSASADEWHRWQADDGAALLVALHACGGLSDVALRLAAACGASCLVCTCCFGKHRALSPASDWSFSGGEDEKDVLCRMADCVEPEISAEARRVVSSLRLQALRRQMRPGSAVACASMRTFPETYSRQNVVLCAACEVYA